MVWNMIHVRSGFDEKQCNKILYAINEMNIVNWILDQTTKSNFNDNISAMFPSRRHETFFAQHTLKWSTTCQTEKGMPRKHKQIKYRMTWVETSPPNIYNTRYATHLNWKTGYCQKSSILRVKKKTVNYFRRQQQQQQRHEKWHKQRPWKYLWTMHSIK